MNASVPVPLSTQVALTALRFAPQWPRRCFCIILEERGTKPTMDGVATFSVCIPPLLFTLPLLTLYKRQRTSIKVIFKRQGQNWVVWFIFSQIPNGLNFPAAAAAPPPRVSGTSLTLRSYIESQCAAHSHEHKHAFVSAFVLSQRSVWESVGMRQRKRVLGHKTWFSCMSEKL